MLTHLMFLMLAGCPDPTTAADLGNPGPGGGLGGSGGGEGPGGPPPQPGQFELAEGVGVTLTGSLSYGGDKRGQVRIDVLRTPEDAPPILLHVAKLDAIGNYTIEAPPNTGEVSLVAFVDAKDDGPSKDDPAGLITINIEEKDISDIDIQLSDAPDLGALTPGDAPPTPTDQTPDDTTGLERTLPPSQPEETALPAAEAKATPPDVGAETHTAE